MSELVTAQLADGTLHLTVDMGGLDFADTAGIRVFLLAAKTLRQRGGDLMLLRRNVRCSGCWKSSAQVR